MTPQVNGEVISCKEWKTYFLLLMPLGKNNLSYLVFSLLSFSLILVYDRI